MTPEELSGLRLDAQKCAGHLRLSLRERNWQGAQGNWAGAGIGSSIDFQDHRPYMPGDDPRYIDWAAYARSGQTIMKLYREEVSPRMDLVLDSSQSMFFDSEKEAQTLRLFFFCIESALAISASLRIYLLSENHLELLSVEQALNLDKFRTSEKAESGIPSLGKLPFRNNAMRLFISDLLYDSPPDPLLATLVAQRGKGVILAPYLEKEQNPEWSGNMELVECETGLRRRQRVDPALLYRYKKTYANHLSSWDESCRKYQVQFARVPCEGGLAQGLETEALSKGVVETWG